MKNEKWGIRYKCPICGILIKFPTTPNVDTNKHEALAHAIYSCLARDKGPCWRCKK